MVLQKDAFDKDFEMTHNSLSQMAVTTTTTQQKAFYDDLHISPLMVIVNTRVFVTLRILGNEMYVCVSETRFDSRLTEGF